LAAKLQLVCGQVTFLYMPNDYSRREGYRAVSLRIIESRGVERSNAWIGETEDPISKSGAILGMVEFLSPEPTELDDIPKVVSSGC